MKQAKQKHLLRGLKNIQSKYYCEFSEKEHVIINAVISEFKRKVRPKNKWGKTIRKILKRMAEIILNMF